ncbi:MAG: DNA primase [Candidatus Bathyarchaeia archaeon]|nr:DNA primase [Candidatus Bathyarchaeota archaeon]
MNRYYLPKGMRPSTLEERKQFYEREFNLDGVREWLRDWRGKVIFAVIIGRHTRIYPLEYADEASTTILIENYKGLEDVRSWILEFLPESVYYDRNVYDEEGHILGQELAFDIDPENFTCPIHGSLEDKMRRHQGLSFCELELDAARRETIRFYEVLSEIFTDLKIVYSGRGFHIHVFDEDAFNWSYEKRSAFARDMRNRGFIFDEWVTSGGMRLIRLPYSLHGMVSRIVMPVDISELERPNLVDDERFIPMFLRGER